MMPKTKKTPTSSKKSASVGSGKKGSEMSEFLNSIFNAITDGITVLDRDYKIIYINRSLAHFYGYEKPEEVIGKNCYEAFRGEKKVCKQCPTKEIFETGNLHHEFHSASDPHGNEIHWEIYFYPIYDDKGEVESVVEYSKNITREKLLEKRAEESERKLSDLVSISRDVIVEYNSKMELTFVSENIKDFLGYSADEILEAESFFKFVPPETRNLIMENFKARMAGKRVPKLYESEMLHKDGRRIPIEIQVVLVKEEGKISGGVATIRDITERKKAEKTLKESEELLRKFMDSATDGFALFDSQLNLLDVNKTAFKTYGTLKKEVIGKNIVDIVPNIKETGRYDEHMNVIKTGKPSIAEDLVPHPKFGDVYLTVKSFKVGDGLGLIVTDITKRKKAEEALFESEKRYRTLFEKSPASITLLDKSGAVIDCNKSTEKLIGYSKKDITGKRFEKQLSLSKKDLPKLKEKYKKLVMGKTIKPFELEITRKNGEKRWINVTIAFIKKDKEIVGFQVISTDITERKEAERTLQESEELYRTIIETSPDGIVLTDLDTNIIMTNPAGAQSMGYDSPEDLVGRSAFDLMAPEDLPRIMESIEEMFDKGKVKNAEFNFLKKDGSRLPVEFNASLLYDEKGEPTSFMGISRNLSERKKAQEQIRVANERLQYLLSSTSAVIYTAKTSGDYGATFISENVTQLVGYKSKDFLKIPRFWIDHVHPDDRKRTLKESSLVFKKKRHAHEYRFKCKDGRYIWVRDEMKLVQDEDGKPLEIVGYWVDITDRKQAEEKLRESEEQYRAIFEQAADSIVLIDAETGALVNFNEKAHENLGYTSEEFKELKIPDFEVIESTEEVAEHIEKIVVEGVDTFKTKHRTKEGDIRDILVSSKAISIGGKDFVQSLWRDITEQKRAEEKLKESQEKYSNLFHKSNDPIILHDLEGKIVDMNQRGLDIFGYSVDEIIGLKISTLHPKEALKKSKNAFKKIAKTGYVSFEIEFKKKNGEIFPAEVSSSLFEIGGKKVIQGIIRDISERKKAQDALKESEEMYKSLVETSPDAITVTDLEGKITFVSDRALELTGVKKAKDVIGKNAFDYIAPEDQELALKNLHNTVKTGFLRNTEYAMLKKDGTRYTGELNAALIKDASGNPKAFIGATRDVTERKKAEEALRYRLAFEEMITSFSTHFLYMETDKIDDGINVSLKDLGIFTQADRSFVFTVYDDGKKMDNTHEWCAEGIDVEKDRLEGLNVNKLKWGMNLMKKLFPLNITDVAGLPKEASADKKLLKSMGIKSFLSVPIVIGGSLYGFVGLGSTRKKMTWSTDIVTLLQFVAEMFANGLERKRAEEVLIESEEKFRSLAEQSPNMIFINIKGQIVYVNEECVKIMGYQREEFYSPDFDFFALIAPESMELVKKSFARHMTGEEIPPYEYTIKTKEGKKMEAIIATKLISYQGDFAIMGIITDITKRKLVEEEIKGLKDFNESIVQSMDEGIMILDNEGLVSFTNPKIEKILGYKQAKLVGEHWENFIAFDYHRRMRDCYSENQKGASDRFDVVLLKKNKTELPVLLSATPQFKDGTFSGILAVITDISKRKKEDIAREELMRYKIKRGSTYLIKEKEFDRGKDVFLELYKNHFKGLIITREHPEKIKREIDLNIPIYWLTKDPKDRNSVKPEFPVLEKIIDDNIDRTTFVLLDRFDYLVTQYSFKEALNFVQHLNEMFYARKAILIISLDPDTLNAQELSLLEKETSILEKKYEERLSADQMDLMDFVNKRNMVGERPSFNEVGDQFKISRTTTRKRIKKLVDKGLLSESKSGRFKYLIVTDKGKETL